jgi:hypothetical protein
MEKKSATRLLTDTLQNPFDEDRFRQFARNLVNDLDESKAFQAQGNYIKDAYKKQVRQYKRIGQYVDPDSNTIDVLVVRLHQPTTLDRARTMQRNFIAQYLQDRGGKEAALVAYYTDGSPDWRFSLVRLDYRLEQQTDGSYKPKKEVTAARRSSFLVGETEPNHTAQQQLLPLLLNDRQNPTLARLEAAFNIESVTKEFFERYKTLFMQVRDEVEALLQNDPVIAADFTQKQIEPANFAKKLLGQIVFLYFLQKKGWLGVESGQPWGSGAKNFLRRLFREENVEYKNFFNDVLEPLFYHALAVDRGSDALYELPGCQQPCKIPFLNGGLFEPIGGYDWQKTNVFIANDTIQNILDTFDLYNFTVREDEPLDKEVAVDPEMLGKVFENLLDVSERKSKGAFYTPREIVHYMCQESLINYLDTTLDRQVPREDMERLVRQGERSLENDAQVMKKGSETQIYQFQVPESVRTHAAEIDRALASIKICDPAIGSGAFPVGIMQEIVKVRGVLTTYLTLTPSPTPQGEDRTAYAFKRHAIQNSIYGVDIDPGAVDIARLRLWLSLVVDEEDYESIKPLPNLDYKIVCGNSLLNVEKNLFNYQVFDELEQQKQVLHEETNADRKTELHATIQELILTITKQNETFDFEVYFSEVFRKNNGFDVVIGNPPYVRMEKIKELKPLLKKIYSCYTGRADLYVYFYEKGIQILKEGGSLAYISSNKWFRANYGTPLRQYIAKHSQIHQIIDFGELPVFEAATFPVIFIAQSGTNHAVTTRFTPVKSLNPPYPDIPTLVQQYGKVLPSSAIQGSDWMLTSSGSADIFRKMEQVGTPLGTYVDGQIFYGIKTGFNKAFVIDGAKRAELIAQYPKSAEIIKPLAVGDDVRKWCVRDSNTYLIYAYHGIDIFQYPAIYDYLLSFQKKLEARATIKSHEWYELQQPQFAYSSSFEKPKIICPEICKEPRFTFDTSGLFTNNKAFIIPLNDLYLLGILNSSCAWEYTKLICSSLGDENKGGRLMLQWVNFKKMPIPSASPADKNAIATLVNYILFLTKELKDIPSHGASLAASAEDKLMLSYFEQIVDAAVMELYLPEELHAGDKYFMRHLVSENLPNLEEMGANKIDGLRVIFRKLFDKEHPVRVNIYFLNSLEVVRRIQGNL